ncbi:nucleotidyltransferase [Chryseobacterium sp. R2A-55]|uniref:nucleotidyltransferase n=1 Tax=Chryseobacterium sp. R2A-55 TaxID=2744445 RepID=UPI001F3AD9A1|nr:nucleotidyltransferase [Chryseobacterium sp. R2A-55]
MARTVPEIKKSITDRFMTEEVLVSVYGLDSSKTFEEQFSIVSFENILVNIFTFILWTLEKLFDQHRSEVSEIVKILKPHGLPWYRQKALDFQYGFDLYPDTDVFNNVGYSAEQIQNSKIIKYAAVTEAVNESRLIVKIATEDSNSELSPISEGQKESFDEYIEEIRDAGVKVTVINYLPDILRLHIKIYYNPLVLTSHGVSILSGKKPVEDSLKAFMKELPFNGQLILASLVDKLQATEGVDIPHLVSASSSWVSENGYSDFENIGVRKIPVSGYFKIENFANIEYIPN